MKPQALYARYSIYIKPVTKLPIVKTYGSIIFTLIIIAIFIFFAIKPTIETILILQKKLSETTQILDKVNKKAADLSLGKQNYENLGTDLKEKISQQIPDNITLRSITQNLEQTARLHEASISALQIQPISLETKNKNSIGSISEIDFTFNVEGDYQNLNTLLQDLNTSSRLFSVDSVSLSKLPEGNNLIMSISGKAYYIK